MDVSSQTKAILRWSVGVEMELRVAVICSGLQAGTHNSSACTSSNNTPVNHRRATGKMRKIISACSLALTFQVSEAGMLWKSNKQVKNTTNVFAIGIVNAN